MTKVLPSLSVLLIGLALVACGGPAPEPAPEWLWVPVWAEHKVIAFGPEELATGGGGLIPKLTVGLGPSWRPYTIAFDGNGNLWIGCQNGDVLRIDAEDLRFSGMLTPGAVLTTGQTHVGAIAFGPDGRLWVAGQDRLMAWEPDRIEGMGSPAADVEITGGSIALTFPNSLAFDAGGGLWVGYGGVVLRYAPAQLQTGGSPEPDVVLLTDGTTTLRDVRGLAFDASGSLWVTTAINHRAEKYPPEVLTSSGNPTPTVSLSGLGIFLLRPAFDREGNLWVSSLYDPGHRLDGYVSKVSPDQQLSSGVVDAAVALTSLGGFDTGGHLLFWPAPE